MTDKSQDGAAGAAAPKPDANQAQAPAPDKKDPPEATAINAAAAPQGAVQTGPAPEKKPEPSPTLDRFTEIERQFEARARVIDEKAAQLEAKLERERQKAVLSTLRRMGADAGLISDADLLTLAPKVDPDDPAGLAELVRWKGTKGFFRQAKVGPQESLGELVKAARENKDMPAHLRERKARMLAKVHGGDQ